MRFLFILVFLPSLCSGQSSGAPFELERFENFKYAPVPYSEEMSSAGEILKNYYTEYKRQRAQDPEEYFPSPTALRNELGERLISDYPNHAGTALVRYFQSKGSRAAQARLLDFDAETPELLPYQFLSAFIAKDRDKEILFLKAMDQQGMISPVSKVWGRVSLLSARGSSQILTQGLQDLIAIEYAHLVEGLSNDVKVENILAGEIQGVEEIPGIIDGTWVSPVVETSVLSPFASRLVISGNGFILTGLDISTETIKLDVAAKKIAHERALTPADHGLVWSYSYLADALELAGQTKAASELKKYIEREGLR